MKLIISLDMKTTCLNNWFRLLEAGYINQFPPCVRATLLCSSFKTGSTCHVPKEKRVHLTWSQKPVRNTNLCFAFSCWYYKYRFWLHSFEGVIHIIELRDCFAVHRISSKIIELCNFSLTKVVPDKLSTSVDRKTFLLLLHIPSEIKVVWSSTKYLIIQPRQYIFADGVQSDMLRYIKEKSGGIVVAKDAVTSLVTVWGRGTRFEFTGCSTPTKFSTCLTSYRRIVPKTTRNQ